MQESEDPLFGYLLKAVGLMAAKGGGCWGRWEETIVEVSVEDAIWFVDCA